MRYVSPIRYLNIDTNQVDATGNLPKSVLNLAKKRLLAEIDLSATQTVWVGPTEMTKNDVLKWFETLALSGELGFHAMIARDSVLLEFLEKQRLEARASFDWDLDENEHTDFIAFVSPYYKTSFNKVLVEALEKHQVVLIDTLLHHNPILMTGLDEAATWLKIHHYVKDKLERFEAIVIEIKNKKSYSKEELKSFWDMDMLLSLNHLPDSFQKLRDDYGVALINLSGFSWNRGKYDFAQEVILTAQTLACSPREMQMIQERIKWYEVNLPASAQNGYNGCADTGKSLLRIIFILVLVINLIRFIGTCGSSSEYSSAKERQWQTSKYRDITQQKIYFLPADEKRKMELDSLKNQILSTSNHENIPGLQAILAQYDKELEILETKKVNMEELMKHKILTEQLRLQKWDTIKLPKMPKPKFE